MPATRYSKSVRWLGGALLLLGGAGGWLGGADGAWAQPDLAQYVDKNRVLLVFARGADDPSFSTQKKIFADAKAGTKERDLVLVRALGDDARDLRRRFKVADGTFAALLIGKDGGEKVRSAKPIAARALFLTIDAMPMRREGGR